MVHTSHQLLTINLIGLVEDTTNLVLVALQSIDSTLELITNVKLVGIKQQDDQVGSLCG